MPNPDLSRRSFLKWNSIAGAGTLLAAGIAPSIFANPYGSANIPASIGGKAVFQGEWPKWPKWIPETDEKQVLEVLRSGVWSRSNLVTEFETQWAATVGSKRALAVVNGTNALTVSLIQHNIGTGDEVLIPPYTFIATPVAVLNTGAMPVFVDTDPATFQMDVSLIESKITPRTRAIIPVHFAGLPSDMVRIMEIAKKHNLIVVEDACQAHLAEINHQQVGTFGHAGCFSFQNSKNLAIGEGGAIVSNDADFIDRCYSYHNFGNPFGTVIGTTNAGTVIKGNKLRMSEYQAAIGLSQLKRLQEQTTLRNENAVYLRSLFESIPGIIPYKLIDNVTRCSYYLFPFRYNKNEFKGLSRNNFIKALVAEGVPCNEGYYPLNTMPYLGDAFKSKNYRKSYTEKELNFSRYSADNKCPKNDQLCEEAVWFSQNILLTGKTQMDGIAEAINKIRNNSEEIRKKLK